MWRFSIDHTVPSCAVLRLKSSIYRFNKDIHSFICNYSYMDNSDYTAQGRVATFSHQHKSQLVWMAAKLWDCPSLLIWRTWTLNRTETPIKTTLLPPSFQINWIAALFSVSRNWNWKKKDLLLLSSGLVQPDQNYHSDHSKLSDKAMPLLCHFHLSICRQCIRPDKFSYGGTGTIQLINTHPAGDSYKHCNRILTGLNEDDWRQCKRGPKKTKAHSMTDTQSSLSAVWSTLPKNMAPNMCKSVIPFHRTLFLCRLIKC